jgi:murein tripeptide amidase MpaA
MLDRPRRAWGMSYLMIVAALAINTPLHAVVTLDINFDSGSLDLAATTVSGSGNTINLVGRDNYYGGDQWRWFYFRASGVQGKTNLFSISDNFAGGAYTLDYTSMKYSYDNQTWFEFDNHTMTGGAYRFQNNAPFTQDQVYVAYSYPYPYSRTADKVNEWKQSPYVGQTISSNADLVIGQSPGGVDDLGRTIAPRDMWAFKITDSSVPSAGKKKIVFDASMHAGEVLSNWTLEGTIEFLISDDPRAVELRKHAEFFVYPQTNPDGRFAGNNRATIQNPNQDPNGYWTPARWANKPDLKLTGEAMLADLEVSTGGEADYFIDYHSSIWDPVGDDWMYIHEQLGHVADPFWQRLTGLSPHLQWEQSGGINSNTLASFGRNYLGADFDATFETMFLSGRNIDHYLTLGKNVGIAFYEALARIPGDINADGFVGIADLNILLGSWNQAVPLGDIDAGDIAGIGDGFIGIDDLNVVLSNWNAGVPPVDAANIPEPASLVLLVLGAAGISWRG